MAIGSLLGIQTAVSQTIGILSTTSSLVSTAQFPRHGFINSPYSPKTIPLTATSLTTSNGLQFANAANGNSSYVGRIDFSAPPLNVANSNRYVIIIDILWTNPLSNNTSLQPVNYFPIVNRDINGGSDGTGVYVLLANGTSNLGGAAATCTISYTSSSGQQGRTGITQSFTGISAGVALPFSLANGDVGVQSVQTAQFSGSPGGTMYLLAFRPVAMVSAGNGPDFDMIADALSLALPRVYDNSCIHFLYGGGSSARGNIEIIQG